MAKWSEERNPLEKFLLPSAQSSAAIRQLAAWRVLVVLCGVAFISNVLISLIAPILPVHFESIGMSPIWCGMVFSCFPAAMLLFSPVAVKAMARYGRVPVLFFGLVLQGVANISFGYADELTGGAGSDRGAALAIYTLSRLACGAGGAAANNAVFSVAADRFPNTLAKVMGLNEAVIGAGFTLGPLIGSALFLKYGFKDVFLTSGLAILLFAPFSLVLWQPRRPLSVEELVAAAEEKGRCGGFGEVLTPGLLCAGLNLLLGTGVFGMVEPILGPYLSHEVGVVDSASIGAFFAALAFSFSAAGPVAGVLADMAGALRVSACGSIGSGLVLLALLGPTARLFPKGSPQRISYEVFGLVVLGVFQACILIPSLPAMKNSVPSCSSSATERVVAWFNMFMQSGLIICPLLGSAMRDAIGFEVTVALYGVCVAAYGIGALHFASRLRTSPSVATSTPSHLITGVVVSPLPQLQRETLPETVLRKISY